MKFILILFLLIPNLSWGSEKKAREIFVNAKKDYATTGCTSADLFKNQKEITEFVTDLVLGISKKTLTVVKGSVMHYQEELDEKIVCYKAYLEVLAPAYNQIIDKFPETEVAYNIMTSGEYIANNQVEIINQNLKLISSKLKELDEELKDEAKSFKVDKDILDKAIDEIKKEKKKSEPMTVAEVYELTKQIHSCLELNIGAKDLAM